MILLTGAPGRTGGAVAVPRRAISLAFRERVPGADRSAAGRETGAGYETGVAA